MTLTPDTAPDTRLTRLQKLAEQCREINSEDTQQALLSGIVPRFALLTSEGSFDNTYSDNPDLTVYDDAGALGDAIADSMEEGWPPRTVVDLDTGEEVEYKVTVALPGVTVVHTVEVFGRGDGVYVFADQSDAAAFEQAVNQAAGFDSPESMALESACIRREQTVCDHALAEELIRAERESA